MNLVCFSNVASTLLIIEIVRTYGFSLIAKLFFGEKPRHTAQIILAISNLLLHAAAFIVLLVISTPSEELLMLCLGSAALALTVAGIKRRG